jgi:hypothetical protein
MLTMCQLLTKGQNPSRQHPPAAAICPEEGFVPGGEGLVDFSIAECVEGLVDFSVAECVKHFD